MNFLAQFWHAVAKVFDLPRRLRGLTDHRQDPRIPPPILWTTLLLGAVLRVPSFLQLQKETTRRGMQRLLAWSGRLSDDALAYGTEQAHLAELRGLLVSVNRTLKQNKAFEAAKINGLLVVGLQADDPIEVSYGRPIPGEPTGVSHRDALKMDWSHGHNMAVVNRIGRIGYMKGGKAALWVDEDMADVFTKHALAFIEREKDRPFFLYFATHDVHVPRVPHPRFVGQSGMGPRGDARVQFDWCVGEILKKLDQLQLARNTLVILTSDNGPVLDDGYKDDANEKLGNHKPAGPLRGGKYSLFEGGTRMPWLVRWPAKVNPGVSDALVSQVDLPATLAALTGQKPETLGLADSVNVLPALLGQSNTGRDHIVEHAGRLALRQGNWKFIPPGQTRDQLGPWSNIKVPEPGFLFDLSSDPSEPRNLAAQKPEKVSELSALLEKIRGQAVPQ